MGVFRFIGNYAKQKAITKVANSSGFARDLIGIHQIKQRENAQNTFGVRLEYVPGESEEAVIAFSNELFGMQRDEVLNYIAVTPVIYAKGLNNAEAKEVIKMLKKMGVQATISKGR